MEEMMFDPEIQKRLDDEWRRVSLVWAGLLCSLGIYLLVGYFIHSQMEFRERELPYTLIRNILFLIAAAQFLGIFVLRKALLQMFSKNDGPTRIPAYKKISQYKTAVILSGALSEGIVVYGFILLILFRDLQNFYILTAISAFGLILHRPKKEEMERIIPTSA
jgi:hypothetical protein